MTSTSSEAKRTGAGFFFTGKPCRRGHVAKRYASGSCVECKTEDRTKNREATIQYVREWRKRNPEKTREYHEKEKAAGYGKEYYKKNRERQIEKSTNWRLANLERARETVRVWYGKNREWVNERNKRYRAKTRFRNQKYREADREKYRLKTKEWRIKYPDRDRASQINKKAKRKLAEGKFTAQDINHRLMAQRDRCALCAVRLNGSYHIDHINPLSRGGTNWPKNIQLLCESCNLRKHSSDPIDFARREGRLL